MSIIGTIKRLLGMDDGREERSSDPAVTIEREAGEPSTESESAVKAGTAGETNGAGTVESDTSDTDTSATDATTEASATTDAGATTDTGSTSDAGATTDASGETAETGGAATDTGGDATAAGAATTPETGDDTESAAASASVEEIKGIGPAYGDRLADAGVETVADLRDGDPVRLAEAVKVGESRVRRWIDRAHEYE